MARFATYNFGGEPFLTGRQRSDNRKTMEKITLYLRESYQELVNHVSWPTFNQVVESTIVVLVTAFILAMIIFVMDGLSSVVFKSIYGIF